MNKNDTRLLKRFGKRVNKFRRELKLSQDELAKAAKLDRTYISGIERGLENPSLRSIERLSRVLEVSISELLEVR